MKTWLESTRISIYPSDIMIHYIFWVPSMLDGSAVEAKKYDALKNIQTGVIRHLSLLL